ncbi:putative reverse transcriptase domain-containing protein [Tanacetum coccineum]
MIHQGVTPALAGRDATRNGDDSHTSGMGVRKTERVALECTYQDFMKCQPLYFKGTEGVVELTQWCFNVVERQVSRNSVVQDVMSRRNDVTGVQSRFQELQLLCVSMFPKELARLKGSNQRGNGTGQGPTCFKCGVRGHFKTDFPKLKNNNNNRGKQVRNANAPTKVFVVGHAGINPDSNVVTSTFLFNNRYASILFDTGADRNDRRIIGLNTILRGCTLNLLNHPFNINLIPIELGSFDAIIGMDWLAKYQAIIVYVEKIVCIPWGNETLIVHGDESNRGNETQLNIIFCTKTQKYLLKGCPIFLAHVTTKKAEDKSEEKRLEDVPIV